MVADRVFLAFGGLCGALGVALSAAAAHSGSGNVGTVANFLMFHAPAFIALSIVPRGTFLAVACWVLFAGLAIFCGDLMARDYLGTRLFPFAAPIGGSGMILGWLLVAASSLISIRKPAK
ncbi:DUF423 domain-containing protein [Corticibacterium sp. UT-5YL-CI-8]|nr:DUF423 domain-containing protein [Tianweitania sp. UT-5YL-CI-8]